MFVRFSKKALSLSLVRERKLKTILLAEEKASESERRSLETTAKIARDIYVKLTLVVIAFNLAGEDLAK